jgi:hypothetical protein
MRPFVDLKRFDQTESGFGPLRLPFAIALVLLDGAGGPDRKKIEGVGNNSRVRRARSSPSYYLEGSQT